MILKHRFVETIPAQLEEMTIYISVVHSTAVHKCVCGCCNEVVTPFSPTDWNLTFDGKSVSLHPSIGNWSFDCKSHYWIRKSHVEFARLWSEKEIKKGKKIDKREKRKYFKKKGAFLSRLFSW